MKKWISMLLVMLLSLALVACGGDVDEAPDTDNTKPTTASRPTDEPTQPNEEPTDPAPTDPIPTDPQPTEPAAPVEPTLPDEGQDPGGFGPIF